MRRYSILYIGQLINPEEKSSYSGASNAGMQFEWNMINNLSQKDSINRIVTITVPPVATWPHDKKIIFRTQYSAVSNTFVTYEVGFINLPLVKQLSQIVSTYRIGKKVHKSNQFDVIMSYNTYPQVGFPAYRLAKEYHTRHICVLADLPFDDRKSKNSPLRRMIWSVYGGTAWKLIAKIKEFVVLNEYAKNYLPSGSRVCVMEGAVQPEQFHYLKVKDTDDNGRKIILYTGALTEYSGVIQLVKAISALSELDVVLHIYGNGDLKNEIIKMCEKINNVEYKGVVSVDEIRNIQANSWLLVNPRSVTDEISKVTFPSKILEYMASGTPVLTTRINGMSSEYSDKLFLCENNQASVLETAIRIVYLCETDTIGQKAKSFVMQKKNWSIQTDTILALIASNVTSVLERKVE